MLNSTSRRSTLDEWRKNTNKTSRELGDVSHLNNRFSHYTFNLSAIGVGSFAPNDIITGSVTGATATVINYSPSDKTLLVKSVSGTFVDAETDKYLLYLANNPIGSFDVGDTVTGSVSGASAKVFAVSTSASSKYIVVYDITGVFRKNELLINESTSGVSDTVAEFSLVAFNEFYRGENITNGTAIYELITANKDVVTAVNEMIDGGIIQSKLNGISVNDDGSLTNIVFGEAVLEITVPDASGILVGDSVAQEVSPGEFVYGTVSNVSGTIVSVIDIIENNGLSFTFTATGGAGPLLVLTSAGYVDPTSGSEATITGIEYVTNDPYLSYNSSLDRLSLFGPSTGNAEFYSRTIRAHQFYSPSGSLYFMRPDNGSDTGNAFILRGRGALSGDRLFLGALTANSGQLIYTNGTSTFDFDITGATGTAVVKAGTMQATTASRSPIYYDDSGTTFYLNLASSGTSLNTSGTLKTVNGGVIIGQTGRISDPYLSFVGPAGDGTSITYLGGVLNLGGAPVTANTFYTSVLKSTAGTPWQLDLEGGLTPKVSARFPGHIELGQDGWSPEYTSLYIDFITSGDNGTLIWNGTENRFETGGSSAATISFYAPVFEATVGFKSDSYRDSTGDSQFFLSPKGTGELVSLAIAKGAIIDDGDLQFKTYSDGDGGGAISYVGGIANKFVFYGNGYEPVIIESEGSFKAPKLTLTLPTIDDVDITPINRNNDITDAFRRVLNLSVGDLPWGIYSQGRIEATELKSQETVTNTISSQSNNYVFIDDVLQLKSHDVEPSPAIAGMIARASSLWNPDPGAFPSGSPIGSYPVYYDGTTWRAFLLGEGL